jgi:2-oxoglutarate dehydrogenase E1 component
MANQTYDDFEQSSYLAGGNSIYIEMMYEDYLKDPASVSSEWQAFFKQVRTDDKGNLEAPISHATVIDAIKHSPAVGQSSSAVACSDKQAAVNRLIRNYRNLGHLNADIDPLSLHQHAVDPRLQLSTYGLTQNDLQEKFSAEGLLPDGATPLKNIVEALQKTYCGKVGFQFEYIICEEQRTWLENYIEHQFWQESIPLKDKKNALNGLIAANGLEQYLEVKYPGQKRFSIEGLDAIIPALNHIVQEAGKNEIGEVVMCMAHRGRLNVMVNVVGKSVTSLCDDFAGKTVDADTSGDVKYHMGYSSDVKVQNNHVHLSLLFNPSHLDYIAPVLLGSVRGRQDLQSNHADKTDYALGVMLHGDASYSGQGIIMETLVMSGTDANDVGGVIHIVTNNQIGFTTVTLDHIVRKNAYCTDVSKTIAAPVLHVNADDMNAVLRTVQMAFAYRKHFKQDIVIDLVGYRRHGHQEVDEPRATQPKMYSIIKNHPRAYKLYGEELVHAKQLSQDQLDADCNSFRDDLEAGKSFVQTLKQGKESEHAAIWKPYINQSWDQETKTSVPLKTLKSLGGKVATYPESMTLLKQIKAIMVARDKMYHDEQPLDWGAAEMLAYATLLNEGISVRLSGEDVCRGTFFHRHATLTDQVTNETYKPLQHINNDASMDVYDSILAEAGPLGFEYGYATARPNALVIWEAQFGDFANSAQVIIDQFISSAWQKWKRDSGLVMLLPHGYEGMGPEHSSARLERYLQLCAQDNMQVCIPSTPSQIFHLLRRQIVRHYRRPLVVMSPKSLLRHKQATSSLKELAEGYFQLVIDDQDTAIKPDKVKRVICCSGKVYYDLLAARTEAKQTDVALVRIEQLYPFPYDALKAVLKRYAKATTLCWTQEEPKNQGAWYITQHRLNYCLQEGQTLMLSSRDAMAAPAVGYPSRFKTEQKQLVQNALDLDFN